MPFYDGTCLLKKKFDVVFSSSTDISCRQENTCNATILKTDPLGIASQKLLVGKGDTIIGINGVSLIDATYNEIVAAIRSSKDTIKILVQEARAGREEFEPTPPPSFCYLLCCFYSKL